MKSSNAENAPAAQYSDSELEQALRDAVQASFSAGKTEELTVKRLRTVVESQLGLGQTFFKAHDTWNTKSKNIIQDAVDGHEEVDDRATSRSSAGPNDLKEEESTLGNNGKRPSPEPYQSKPKRAKLSPDPDAQSINPTHAAPKRPSPDDSAESESRKRRKLSQSPELKSQSSSTAKLRTKSGSEESESELSEAPSEVEPPPPKPKPASKRASASLHGSKNDAQKNAMLMRKKGEEQETREEISIDAKRPKNTSKIKSDSSASAKNDVPDDSSELSSLIDSEPAPKKRGRKTKERSPKPVKNKKFTAKSNKSKSSSATTELAPDEVEIKRLQSWLVKCGIRKLWHRELAPHSSTAAKIAHLKQMLRDVGMEGRFSVEKARAVKERRELEQDLEAVREGERRWGNRNGEDGGSQGEEDEGDGKKPKRRLAKSLQGLDFLNDDDGEETD